MFTKLMKSVKLPFQERKLRKAIHEMIDQLPDTAVGAELREAWLEVLSHMDRLQSVEDRWRFVNVNFKGQKTGLVFEWGLDSQPNLEAHIHIHHPFQIPPRSSPHNISTFFTSRTQLHISLQYLGGGPLGVFLDVLANSSVPWAYEYKYINEKWTYWTTDMVFLTKKDVGIAITVRSAYW